MLLDFCLLSCTSWSLICLSQAVLMKRLIVLSSIASIFRIVGQDYCYACVVAKIFVTTI